MEFISNHKGTTSTTYRIGKHGPIIFTGEGAPASSECSLAPLSSIYLRTDTGDVYKKKSNTKWTKMISEDDISTILNSQVKKLQNYIDSTSFDSKTLTADVVFDDYKIQYGYPISISLYGDDGQEIQCKHKFNVTNGTLSVTITKTIYNALINNGSGIIIQGSF